MTAARVEQITKPPPDAMVLDRCGSCGEVMSEKLVKMKNRGVRYCDRCDGAKLPQPWNRDDYYDDDSYEPAPTCGRCGESNFTITFTRPNGERVEHDVTEDTWCEDHAVYHLDYSEVIAEPEEDEDDPVYNSARCTGCDYNVYVGFDWEA